MDVLTALRITVTSIFLLTILSYYVLLFVRSKKPRSHALFQSISILIPAHNEEKYIQQAVESVQKAEFKGRKQIIVIDDGSRDKTPQILSRIKGIQLIKTKHSGKAASLNLALRNATGDIIAVVDGDSVIEENALEELAKELCRKNVAAATGVVKVQNRKKHICMWVHIEQLYNSLMRSLLSKINANIVTPGPLSMYRKKELLAAGGFSTKGFSEDIDITIRMIRKGHRIGFSEKAVAFTNMPYDVKGFFRQRTRFIRGLMNILKRHMQLNNKIIDIYTLPLFLFSYIQAVIMGSFTLYQIISGYTQYFTAKGIYMSTEVLIFLFEWFSIIGFVKWALSVISGQTPLTLLVSVGILSTLLSYPLFLFAILKFDKKIDLWHVIPFFFMFPFWLLIMVLHILCLPEYFRKSQYNIWKKNE